MYCRVQHAPKPVHGGEPGGSVSPGPGWPPRPGSDDIALVVKWAALREPIGNVRRGADPARVILWPGYPKPVQPVGRSGRHRARIAPIIGCHQAPMPWGRTPSDSGISRSRSSRIHAGVGFSTYRRRAPADETRVQGDGPCESYDGPYAMSGCHLPAPPALERNADNRRCCRSRTMCGDRTTIPRAGLSGNCRSCR